MLQADFARMLQVPAHVGAASAANHFVPVLPTASGPAAALLQEQYRNIEDAYTAGLATAFSHVRAARERRLRYWSSQRTAFLAYLERPAPDKDMLVCSIGTSQYAVCWHCL